MHIFKIFMSVFLCLSISTYGLPTFASVNQASVVSKITLSEVDMEAAIGGSLHTEILSTGLYEGDEIKALVAVGANGFGGFAYSLESVSSSGEVMRTLDSGTINSNETRLISGVRESGDYFFRVKLTFTAVPVIASQDTSVPQFE